MRPLSLASSLCPLRLWNVALTRRAPAGTSQSFYVNDGTRDIGSAPSSTLLFRGLDPLTAEDEIFSTLSRVGGRANQEIAKGGVRRVMVAKDRASRSSWGFAFVQFVDVRVRRHLIFLLTGRRDDV